MSENEAFGLRLNPELSGWIRKKARAEKCSTSDLIRKAILTFKQVEETPDDMRFSNLINIQASKATMLTYRLLEKFIKNPNMDGLELAKKAKTHGLKDIEKWKI